MQIYLFNALKILNGCCCRHYIVIGFPVQINLFKALKILNGCWHYSHWFPRFLFNLAVTIYESLELEVDLLGMLS